MEEATAIILAHQLLFQGMFATKNILLKRKLGQPIRGTNPEANRSIGFFFLFIALSLFLAQSAPAGLKALPGSVTLSLAILLMIGNLLVGLASLRDLGESWRVGVLEEQRTELVQTGIYGISRNPYFVAYLLMFVAYTVLLQSLVLLALSALGFGMIHSMVRKEEDYLRSVHGQVYSEYQQKVPRYLLI